MRTFRRRRARSIDGRLRPRHGYAREVILGVDPTLPREDPEVALVEQLLRAAALRARETPPLRNGRMVVSHAVWLCACETPDTSPTWLIYAVGRHGVAWQRLRPGQDARRVVDAQHLTGDHLSPSSVLRWLRGAPPAFYSRSPDDPAIYAELHQRIARPGYPGSPD